MTSVEKMLSGDSVAASVLAVFSKFLLAKPPKTVCRDKEMHVRRKVWEEARFDTHCLNELKIKPDKRAGIGVGL